MSAEDFADARGVGPPRHAWSAARIAEGHCPSCRGRLELDERTCPACRHPLATCLRCRLGWWASGAAGTGGWGSVALDEPPVVDGDALAAEIASATGLPRGVVARVLDAELHVLGRLGITSAPAV